MAGEPTLNSGDTGDWVTYLQQLLEHYGLGTGFVAGVFDEITAAAVRLAQQQHSLGTTGTCDDSLWAALTGTATQDTTPNDIAISMQDEVAAPDGETALHELDEMPHHAQATT